MIYQQHKTFVSKENSTVWCILPIFTENVSSERFCLSYNKFNTMLHLCKPSHIITHFLQDHIAVPWTVHIASFMYKFAFMFAIFFPLKTLLFFFSGTAVSHTHSSTPALQFYICFLPVYNSLKIVVRDPLNLTRFLTV